MPQWTPAKEWAGQDAILIGGGPSLRDFDFNQIKGRNTIGCNDAFRLGPEIVKICLFGDNSFFHRAQKDLAQFPNRVVTVAPSLMQSTAPWLLQIRREKTGLFPDAVGWNNSTGAAAINLAILLGATRIFLLGYDAGRSRAGKTHWHDHNPPEKQIPDETYRRFQKGFVTVQRDLAKFPGVHVMNVTDGSSQLHFFTKISWDRFLKYVPPQGRASRCIPCEERRKAAASLAMVTAAALLLQGCAWLEGTHDFGPNAPGYTGPYGFQHHIPPL